jgi:hypothetical protein
VKARLGIYVLGEKIIIRIDLNEMNDISNEKLLAVNVRWSISE